MMKWPQTRLDEHIARVVRYDQQFIKGYRIGEEFGIDRWYAVCMWRDDFQKETCCPHSHRSEEAAERCSRRLQSVMVRAVRQSSRSPLVRTKLPDEPELVPAVAGTLTEHGS